MRVSCLQENLAKGLSIVGRAVATRSTLPVLSNVMLMTDQSRLRLSATDLELGINCWIGAKVEEDGAITVPARLLTDFVNALPPERIDMTLDVRNQTLNIKCARFEADIKGIDATEFPLVPTADSEQQITLSPELLRQMIAQVAFAAATDESRPILTGVLMEFQPDHLTLVAADGFRLSVRTAPLTEAVPEPVSVIVPARAMAELARISAEEEQPILLNVSPTRNQVLFHLHADAGAYQGKVFGIDLVSQVIEGKFPDYNQIIPRSWQTRMVANTTEFLKACRTANIFARTEDNIVKLTIDPGSELVPAHLTISATSAEMGRNVSEIDAAVEGAPLEIAFNVRYLIDVLSVMDTARVVLEATTPTSPGVLKPEGSEEFVHVVMPMYVRTE